MEPQAIAELRKWLDTPLGDGRTTREHLPDCQPSMLAIAVERLCNIIAPSKE